MDQINSNPHYSYAQLYQQLNGTQSKPIAQAAQQAETPAIKAAAQNSNFSSMFADDELAKLQHNLEAVSSLAEKALKKIES